mmetsp:Transcript_12554/g.38920  ORF Transcript_12554/g.38920 Transcript_12554/m.38920 type:complete len:215 (-) Transcript_12554:703-1347(-)
MKSASPAEVTESVTMLAPGESRSTLAHRAAMRRLRLRKRPSDSTSPERSQSVSSTTPRSALAFSTAVAQLPIASASSGLGTWFGNEPSGSRNWLSETSAPSGASTSCAKKPPAPFPASTTTLMPSSGLSPAPTPSTISARSCAAYAGMKSSCGASAYCSAAGNSPRARRPSAILRIALISSLPKPPVLVKNFMPLRLKGRWLAVSITPPSKSYL